MFKNYLKTAWRNLLKNKTFSIINILGLTIGITVCLLIYLFVVNELNMDRFNNNGDHIYRVVRVLNKEGKSIRVAFLSGPYAPALKNDFGDEIKRVVRIIPTDNLVTIGNVSYREKNVLSVDSGFFKLFTFPLIAGNPANVLSDPGNVVLTESTAKKYFGSVQNAMGKLIRIDKDQTLKVAGIAKDVPSNSSLTFDLVTSLANYRDNTIMTKWMANGLYTYVELSPGTTQAQLEKQFTGFMKKYLGEDMQKFGFDFSLALTPLRNVYFENAVFDGVKHGDKTIVYVFMSVAILILIIACINFMNLSTIRSVDRSKEVGLRKVMGALRSGLVWQFITESILLTALSCLLAFGLFFLILPWYQQILGHTVTIKWNNEYLYFFILGVILIVGLLAGSHPAFVLSRFSSVEVLKGKFRLGKEGSILRQVLVVLQFCISVFLIVGTLVITKQMSYMKNKQLGYNQEQIVMIPIDNDDFYKNVNTFKTNLQNQIQVQSVSLMSGEPGGFFDLRTFNVEGHDEPWPARTEFTDFEFVKTLGIKIIAGRNFSPQFPTDSTDAVLINQAAAAKLGWSPEIAVGKWIQSLAGDNVRQKIIGVVKDFNFQSLKENIEPLVISPGKDLRIALIKLKAGNIQSGLAAIKNEYSKDVPAYPLEYQFLDRQFNDIYQKDLRQQTILSVFAVLAIFIACLGLFGLTSYATAKRFKEIGVRKVLGSSVKGIVLLLSKDLLKPVFIATSIALPAGYWVMDRWLQNFAYRTNLSWWIFFIAALITFLIAFATVISKSALAAKANPVESLRTE